MNTKFNLSLELYLFKTISRVKHKSDFSFDVLIINTTTDFDQIEKTKN